MTAPSPGAAVHSLPPGAYRPPPDPWLDIIFEDAAILVLNKPPGLLTVPGRAVHLADCLAARAETHAPGARIVHRLDMETSGLLVMAKTPEAQSALSRQFQARTVSKRYIAVVTGRLAADSGTIDLPLICDWPNRPRQMVDHAVGKPAQTDFIVLDRQADRSRVALTPITGRSHQLRVHMLSLGHPILGDRLYGSPASQNAANRLLLHAERLSFDHPISGERQAFDSAPAL